MLGNSQSDRAPRPAPRRGRLALALGGGSARGLAHIDVAWMLNPEIVVAVQVGAPRERRLPQLEWWLSTWLSRLGQIIPNPGTAKVTLEVLMRAAEIMLTRQMGLAAAMTSPEVLIEPELGDIGLRDFHRLAGAVEAGRRAAEAALPQLLRLMEDPVGAARTAERTLSLRFDPVCAMVINPSRARSSAVYRARNYYFCSSNCRDCFERDPARYLEGTAVDFGTEPREEEA